MSLDSRLEEDDEGDEEDDEGGEDDEEDDEGGGLGLFLVGVENGSRSST